MFVSEFGLLRQRERSPPRDTHWRQAPATTYNCLALALGPLLLLLLGTYLVLLSNAPLVFCVRAMVFVASLGPNLPNWKSANQWTRDLFGEQSTGAGTDQGDPHTSGSDNMGSLWWNHLSTCL